MAQVAQVTDTELRTVTIPVDEYRNYVNDSCMLDVLINAIYNGATLSWAGDKLEFSGAVLEPIIRALTPIEYQAVLEAFKDERENKDGTD